VDPLVLIGADLLGDAPADAFRPGADASADASLEARLLDLSGRRP
jgi:hypothetical protein